jgi:hypothetical protein
VVAVVVMKAVAAVVVMKIVAAVVMKTVAAVMKTVAAVMKAVAAVMKAVAVVVVMKIVAVVVVVSIIVVHMNNVQTIDLAVNLETARNIVVLQVVAMIIMKEDPDNLMIAVDMVNKE